MTAVGLLATVAGSGTGETETGGRSSAVSGSLFGDALIAAGRVIDGATDQGAATLTPDGQDAPTAEETAASDDASGAEAPIATMMHLTAQFAPAAAAAAPAPTSAPAQRTPDATTLDGSTLVQTSPEASEAAGSARTAPAAASGEARPAELPAGPAAAAVETGATVTSPPLGVSAAERTPAPEISSASASASASGADGAPPVAGARVRPETLSSDAPRDAPVTGEQDPAEGDADPATSSAAAAVPRSESPRSAVSSTPIPTTVGVSAASMMGGQAEPLPASDSVDPLPGPQPGSPPMTLAPVASPAAATAMPVSSPEAAASTNRAVAAQVAPVVVSIAQRPMGTHQLTMTVNPDSLGPVTVRAHISAAGEVQVEVSGATDAGRDALRTMLVDLRRDLAAVMPHATLNVFHGASADTAGDRGQQGAGDASPEQGSGDRDAQRGRSDQRRGAEQSPDLSRIIPTTSSAASGAGLDIFA